MVAAAPVFAAKNRVYGEKITFMKTRVVNLGHGWRVMGNTSRRRDLGDNGSKNDVKAGRRLHLEMPHEPSETQKKAIECEVGPVMVLAGPGAGKTYCLIERIRFLVAERGFDPSRICAVTYTNKAAEEIAIRLKDVLGQAVENVTRGTLHSLCLTILREFASLVELRSGFGVADEEYQSLVLRRLDVFPVKRHRPLLQLFGSRRRAGRPLTAEDEKLFTRYQNFLRAKNMVDFDDIVSLTRKLLNENEQVAKQVGKRWDYLLVDEFQDLSVAQYDVVRTLAAGHGNLFGVGDDDQSIFSWAGADPKIISDFQRDFDVDVPVVLKENRRCSIQIFEAARNLLAANPSLFEKQLEATRRGEYEVEVRSFPTEIEEGRWLVGEIARDKEERELNWGDFAVLYRTHATGDDIERWLLEAGIPGRLARGRAISDDRVVAFVLGSLRLMVFGEDSVVVEGFAANMFPAHLMEALRAERPADGQGFLDVMRNFARARRGDGDAKMVWRMIYHIENMQGLFKSHSTLPALIEDLLSQVRGRYRNKLEDNADDLEDPAAYEGARDLAGRIERAMSGGGKVWLTPMSGLEIGILGMFIQSNLSAVCGYLKEDSQVGEFDVVVGPDLVRSGTLSTLVFKALQLIASRDFNSGLREYVAFDLETTDKDIGECEIVEIGAAKVRDGEVVDTFHSLVKPRRKISQGAREVHGYSEEDLVGAPSFETVWAKFREFVGDDLLVAHNGQEFDVPVVRRMAEGLPGIEDLSFFDTLPLARSLFESSASLEALAERFGVDKGRAHHADDDAVTLAKVLGHLNAVKLARSRKCALANTLDFLGLSLALAPAENRNRDDGVLFKLSRINALGPFSDCLDFYDLQRQSISGREVVSLDIVIKALGGETLRKRLREKKSAADRYPQSVKRLASLVSVSSAETLEESAEVMLEKATLSSSESAETDPYRVNLLTLHSTKGLEFSRVFIVGMEDNRIPGWREIKENNETAIQESRRLVYVGMTRAIERLVLTRVDERTGNFSGGNKFLDEIGVPIRGDETTFE